MEEFPEELLVELVTWVWVVQAMGLELLQVRWV